jgi:hypothetical protein
MKDCQSKFVTNKMKLKFHRQ